MDKIFNWCFIGAGSFANKIAKTITKSGRHKIVSVYTRNPEKCKKFADKYGAEAFDSAEKAITCANVDGVYVVTPQSSHFEYARLAVSLKKPVLVEKPFTVTAEQARTLYADAREQGVYIAEAMWTWFSPCAHRVKKLLDEGAIGKIISAEATLNIRIGDKSSRLYDPKRGGGALLDVGVYPIAYMLRLFGAPDKIECSGKTGYGVDLTNSVKLTFGDAIAVCNSSIVSTYKNKLKIMGSAGTVKSDFFHSSGKATVRIADKKIKIREVCNYINEFDLVTEEIRSGAKVSRFVPPDDTVATVGVLEECLKQMNLQPASTVGIIKNKA